MVIKLFVTLTMCTGFAIGPLFGQERSRTDGTGEGITDPRIREHLDRSREAQPDTILRALEARREAMGQRREPSAELRRPDAPGGVAPLDPMAPTRPQWAEPLPPDASDAFKTPRPGYDIEPPRDPGAFRIEPPDTGPPTPPRRPDTGNPGVDFGRLDRLEQQYEQQRIARELNLQQQTPPGQLFRGPTGRSELVDPTFGQFRSQGTHLDSPYNRRSYGFGSALDDYRPYSPGFQESLIPRRLDNLHDGRLRSPEVRPDPRASRSPYGMSPMQGLRPGSDYHPRRR